MLSADKFIEYWKQFSQDFISKNPDWFTLYEDNSHWTSRFLGGKKVALMVHQLEISSSKKSQVFVIEQKMAHLTLHFHYHQTILGFRTYIKAILIFLMLTVFIQ